MKTRTYNKSVKSPFLVLRDEAPKVDISEMLPTTPQSKFLDDMAARFLKVFVRLYDNKELNDSDREKLHRYLDKIIEAKDAVNPREPKGGMYLKKF